MQTFTRLDGRSSDFEPALLAAKREVSEDLDQAADIIAAVPPVDRLAPEHLEIIAAGVDALSQRIREAGTILLGAHTLGRSATTYACEWDPG